MLIKSIHASYNGLPMKVEFAIKDKPIKEPNFNFYKHPEGFLIALKNYTQEEKSEIENFVSDNESSVSFQEDTLILKSKINYYLFNLSDYASYFTEKTFFLGFAFQNNEGKVLSESINMFHVTAIK
jgi:hypothetical protein